MTSLFSLNISLKKPVCQQLDLELKAGEVMVLLAKSGAGKSSLFNALAGFHRFTGGHMTFLQQDFHSLPAHKRPVAYVQQQPLLFNHWTLQQHISEVSGLYAAPPDVTQYLAPLELEHLQHAKATTLSGGQKQRLALLLAFIRQAPLLLLDEVFSGQDSAMRQQCFAVLQNYLSHQACAVLMACHQLSDANVLANGSLLLKQNLWCRYPLTKGILQYEQQAHSKYFCTLKVHYADEKNSHGLVKLNISKSDQSVFSYPPPEACMAPAGPFEVILDTRQAGVCKLQPGKCCSFLNQIRVRISEVGQDKEGYILLCDLAGQKLSVPLSEKCRQKFPTEPGEQCYLLFQPAALKLPGTGGFFS